MVFASMGAVKISSVMLVLPQYHYLLFLYPGRHFFPFLGQLFGIVTQPTAAKSFGVTHVFQQRQRGRS